MTNMSRELDALVAEKVMGWRRRRMFLAEKREPSHFGPPDGQLPARGDWVWASPNQKSGDYHWLVEDFVGVIPEEQDEDGFHPSTDIAAAWEVVEKLKEMPMVDVMVWWNCGILAAYGESGWECEVGTFDGDNKQETLALSGLCKTAPEAICRAALKVVK